MARHEAPAVGVSQQRGCVSEHRSKADNGAVAARVIGAHLVGNFAVDREVVFMEQSVAKPDGDERID